MAIELKAPRGTNDVLPQDSYKWQYVERVARETAHAFGFREVRFPTFEHTELFERGVGDTTDVVQKEMYTFNDKGGRSITLRPEGTAPVARLCLEHGLFGGLLPLKVFYNNISAFRYEKPQAGRFREFHQFGVELYGARSAESDKEVIELAELMLRRLGLNDIELHINSIGCPNCRARYQQALRDYFAQHLDSLCGTCQSRLERNPMRILDCKSPVCKEIVANAPLILDYICDDCRTHFEQLKGLLDADGVVYGVDPKIVRGLDYYTGLVFELIHRESGLTLAGGGRYDGLVKELDEKQDVCGLGFAAGLERIIAIMEQMDLPFGDAPAADVYLVGMGDAARKKVSTLLRELRLNGINAECDVMDRSLKAQMKYADKIGAGYVIVIGDSELDKGEVTVKNMKTGDQDVVAMDSLQTYFWENL